MDRRNASLLELTEGLQEELLRGCPHLDRTRIASIAHYWLLQAYEMGAFERAELLMAVETQRKTVGRLKDQVRRLLHRISQSR